MPSTYAEFAPPPALRPFVERFWVHRLTWPPPEEGRRLLPDGSVNVVWIDGIGVRIAGPQTTYMTPPPLKHMLAIGATFRPGAAPPVLRTPANVLVDEHIHLDGIDARLSHEMDAALRGASTPAEAVGALARRLQRSIEDRNHPDPVVSQAIAVLRRPSATVADAAAHAYVSERDLQRRFARDVGYGPKTLQRILRFQRFLAAVAGGHRDLARAAAIAGYADQAHLSREARRLADLTPRQLMSWRH